MATTKAGPRRARMKADSIDTGSKMRDDHMRSPDFLDRRGAPAHRVHRHRRQDSAIDWNQPVAADVVLVGWMLRVALDIEAVQGDLPESLPET